MNLRLKKIDLTRGDPKGHPAFDEKKTFVVKWDGEYYIGSFSKVWFGWHFSCGFGMSGGFQYDQPGHNSSSWEGCWQLIES